MQSSRGMVGIIGRQNFKKTRSLAKRHGCCTIFAQENRENRHKGKDNFQKLRLQTNRTNT